MRCSVNSKLSLAFLLAGTVAANDYYTTVEPCRVAPPSLRPPPIYVTKQLQPVSICKPHTVYETKTEGYKVYTTSTVLYPYHEHLWVSTVVPVPYGEGCVTVTKTNQHVTVKEYSTSVTHYTTITPSPVVYTNYNHTTTKVVAPYTKVSSVDVIVIDYVSPFKSIGPHAIPGYGGSGLAVEYDSGKSGHSYQVVDVTKCTNDDCEYYAETWEWSPPATKTSVNVKPYSTSQVVSTPGTYTLTIVPESCETTRVYAPTTITYPETTIVCSEAGEYTATVTPAQYTTTYVSPHGGYTTIYVSTTVTKTYTYTTEECSTHSPTYVHSYTHKPSHTKTYTTPPPDHSGNPYYESDSYYKERDAQAKAALPRALEFRELPKNVVRRGGVLRGRRTAEEEKAAPAQKKRDFGIPKRGLL